jgi:hypothetical protein
MRKRQRSLAWSARSTMRQRSLAWSARSTMRQRSLAWSARSTMRQRSLAWSAMRKCHALTLWEVVRQRQRLRFGNGATTQSPPGVHKVVRQCQRQRLRFGSRVRPRGSRGSWVGCSGGCPCRVRLPGTPAGCLPGTPAGSGCSGACQVTCLWCVVSFPTRHTAGAPHYTPICAMVDGNKRCNNWFFKNLRPDNLYPVGWKIRVFRT